MDTTERTFAVPELVRAIDRFRGSLDGELVDRGRAVDHLLDLRLLAADDGGPLVVADIDRMLTDLPGRTLVERTWLDDRLNLLVAALPA